jgi:putative Holliday junction resolvase
MSSHILISLDVGEKRIGVAVADDSVRIAVPYETIEVNGNEITAIANLVVKQGAEVLVIGYPRNQQGEATAQTDYVENFAKQLEELGPKIVFQDESLTSVIAEQRLIAQKKPYTKGDIDAQAASIILQDYLETHYGY